MKKDYERLNLGSITVRMPSSMIEELDLKCGSGLKYRDRSDAIRSCITLAIRVESLMEIQKDPKKKKEFESKFVSLLKEENIEKSLDTMDPNQLNAMQFYISSLKDKKTQQLIDDIKTS